MKASFRYNYIYKYINVCSGFVVHREGGAFKIRIWRLSSGFPRDLFPFPWDISPSSQVLLVSQFLSGGRELDLLFGSSLCVFRVLDSCLGHGVMGGVKGTIQPEWSAAIDFPEISGGFRYQTIGLSFKSRPCRGRSAALPSGESDRSRFTKNGATSPTRHV